MSKANWEAASAALKAELAAVWGQIQERWSRLPRRWRTAVIAGSAVLACFALYAWMAAGSATLKLVCRHGFRRAEITVRLDGDLVYSGEASGAVRKRYGVLQKVEGTFSKDLAVAAGQHEVEVSVRAASEGFDQTRRCQVQAVAGKQTGLFINADRGREMVLVAQAPLSPQSAGGASWFSIYAGSILMTVAGSAVSATIGFFIQEFLRSRKQPIPDQSSEVAR